LIESLVKTFEYPLYIRYFHRSGKSISFKHFLDSPVKPGNDG